MATEAQSYFVPISNGIFAHCQRIGIAVWVFMWLIDHVTKEVPGTDGHAEGMVYGGRSIRTQEIARDLRIANRTAQDHLDRLVDGGYLRRIDPVKGLASGYAVLRSKKWNRLASRGVELEEPQVTPQESAQVRENVRGVRGKTVEVRGNPLPYIETIHNNTQTKEHVEGSVPPRTLQESKNPQAASTVKEKSVNERPTEFSHALENCWTYYHEKLSRSVTYEFTRQRRAMGEAGLKACERYATKLRAPDPSGSAVDLFKLAIDRLAASEYHNGGKDRSGPKYLGWEQLFRSKDLPCPQKLTDFWLDDERWVR